LKKKLTAVIEGACKSFSVTIDPTNDPEQLAEFNKAQSGAVHYRDYWLLLKRP
jgi:hypothetical protein